MRQGRRSNFSPPNFSLIWTKNPSQIRTNSIVLYDVLVWSADITLASFMIIKLYQPKNQIPLWKGMFLNNWVPSRPEFLSSGAGGFRRLFANVVAWCLQMIKNIFSIPSALYPGCSLSQIQRHHCSLLVYHKIKQLSIWTIGDVSNLASSI